MPDHQLHNLRPANTVPDGTLEPRCGQCRFKLHLLPLSGFRQHRGVTLCSPECHDRYVMACAMQRVRDHVMPYDDIDRLHALEDALEDAANEPQWEPPRPTAYQVEQRQIYDAYRRNAAKSNVRKTAEAGANVIGFILWLVVVSAIAAAIFAACGVNSMR